MNKKLQFATKINGTKGTGLLDLSVTPPELFCICTEENAKTIISWYNDTKDYKKLEDKMEELYAEDSEADLITIGDCVAEHFGYC